MSGPCAKICGLSTLPTVLAAVSHGASHIGFMFVERSSRYVPMALAVSLVQVVPGHIQRVGVFADADDALLAAVVRSGAITALQLHGAESPARVADVRARYGLPVWKALGVRTSADLDAARAFAGCADLLLFDAKPPTAAGSDPALAGGTGVRFDWRLLEGRRWQLPWGLAGGLDADNVSAAVAALKPDLVDVSSGVEDAPGVKSPLKIEAFLKAARA